MWCLLVCVYVCVCLLVCVCVCVHMQVMRALYMALDKRLCVHDELRMAASRYCTTSDLEHTVWVNDPLIVRPAEVSVCAYVCVCCMCVCVIARSVFQVRYRMALFHSELATARSSLKRCLGQIVYLQGLSKVMERLHYLHNTLSLT